MNASNCPSTLTQNLILPCSIALLNAYINNTEAKATILINTKNIAKSLLLISYFIDADCAIIVAICVFLLIFAPASWNRIDEKGGDRGKKLGLLDRTPRLCSLTSQAAEITVVCVSGRAANKPQYTQANAPLSCLEK